MTRAIEVAVKRACSDGHHEPYRLGHDEARTVLDELAGAPADTGAALMRFLHGEGYAVLRVVTERRDGSEDASAWAPLLTLIRLAEYPDPEREALADAFDEEEREEGERLHQQAHAPGTIS